MYSTMKTSEHTVPAYKFPGGAAEATEAAEAAPQAAEAAEAT
jgi:hypothetical protein